MPPQGPKMHLSGVLKRGLPTLATQKNFSSVQKNERAGKIILNIIGSRIIDDDFQIKTLLTFPLL